MLNSAKSIPLAVIFVLLAISAKGQFSANYWYFGEEAGLGFVNQQAKTEVNGALHSNEACATYSDPEGRLLAYSNGETVWDASHSPMQNGQGLSGHNSSSQGVMFIPNPSNQDQAFLFTLGEFGNNNALSWSLIDFSLNGGLGEVVQKNKFMLAGLGEQMAAWQNKNGSYWLVAHSFQSNMFYSWNISQTGVAANPVMSQAGLVDLSGIGCMAISPNGKKLGISYRTLNTCSLFDFDPATGSVASPLLLGSDIFLAYGIAFSPDSRKLYVASSEEVDGGGHRLDAAVLQFDLDLPQLSIPASRVVVGIIGVDRPGALQLAPDGHIYLARYNTSFLGCIEKPNLPANLANYIDQRISLLGNTCNLGLPVFPANNLFYPPGIQAEKICQNQIARFFTKRLIAVDSVNWTIKQPDGSLLFFGNHQQIQTALPQYGEHIVSLTYFRGDYKKVLDYSFFVFPIPKLALPEDTLICPGSTLKIDASMPWMIGDTTLSFVWSNGGNQSNIAVNKAGRYTLEVNNLCGAAKDSVDIGLRALPSVDLGKDTLLCSGKLLPLNVGKVYPDTRILWNTGETTPSVQVTDVPRVSVMMTDACGQAHDEINIQWEKLPGFTLPPRYDLCPGEIASLRAGPDASWLQYRWEDGTPGPERSFIQEGDFWVEMSGKVCRDTAHILMENLSPPDLDLGPDSIICQGDRVYLDATSPRSTYWWSTGSTAAGFWVDNPGLYHVTVTNRCGIRRDSVSIDVVKPPVIDLGLDTVICPHISILLDAQIEGVGAKYVWNDGFDSGIRRVQKPGIYSVEVSNACGSVFDDFVLHIDDDLCDCSAFVPNIFSPNGDGANDQFEIVTECLPVQYNLQVFDRWGELMFHSNNPSSHWPGMSPKGKPCSEGVYYYVLTYESVVPTEGRKLMKGTVTLLR